MLESDRIYSQCKKEHYDTKRCMWLLYGIFLGNKWEKYRLYTQDISNHFDKLLLNLFMYLVRLFKYPSIYNIVSIYHSNSFSRKIKGQRAAFLFVISNTVVLCQVLFAGIVCDCVRTCVVRAYVRASSAWFETASQGVFNELIHSKGLKRS